MASGGLGNLEHDSQLHREPEAVPGDEHPPSVAHTVGAEWRPRADDYQIEEGVEEESEQPSSLTENLSQRVQDEVGAENERGAGADDPNNYSLHSSWSFWFDRADKSATTQDFFAQLRKLCSVKTIKAFWCLYNNVVPVNQLMERESYHLMRGEDRRPVWEDLNNIDGGFWAFKIRKEDTPVVWLELLLAAVGEQFSDVMAEDDEVCGISVKIRGQGTDTIQIWNLDSEKHHDARVMQKVKSLIPNVEINEFYQSSKFKMKDLVHKPPPSHRGGSPPRYHGSSPPRHPPRYFPPGHGHAHGMHPPPNPPHHPHHFGGARFPPPQLGTFPPPPHHFRPGGPPGPRGYSHSHSRPTYNPPS